MTLLTRLTLTGALAAGVIAIAAAARTTTDANGLHRGAAEVQTLGAMAFAPNGTLFIADNRAAALHAIDPEDEGTATFSNRMFARDLDQKVASLLGTTKDRVRFHDMAVHPRSRHIYLTVSRLDGSAAQPALIRVKGPEQLEVVELGNIKFATTAIPGAPARDANTAWGQPQWTLSVTDLAFVDGEVYVAGLSNEQFASSLRRVPFPFSRQGALTTVEIYHTSHDKWETASPIEAFLPITINSTPMIVAGYGCSPIATFARSEIGTAKHLRGKTVAELGGGNRPIDIVRYENKGKDWILVANSHRTLMRLDPVAIASAPAMTTPVSQAYEPGGVGYLPVASAGVMQIDDFNAEMLVMLQRDTESGAVNLVALRKEWL
jgi:hypothetical protein